jgi:hypothetical protein
MNTDYQDNEIYKKPNICGTLGKSVSYFKTQKTKSIVEMTGYLIIFSPL